MYFSNFIMNAYFDFVHFVLSNIDNINIFNKSFVFPGLYLYARLTAEEFFGRKVFPLALLS